MNQMEIAIVASVIAVLVIISLAVRIVRNSARRAQALEWLAKNGQAVNASITSFTPSGTSLTINGHRFLKARFEFESFMQGGGIDSRDLEMYVSETQVPLCQPGRNVELRYHPSRPEAFLLANFGGPGIRGYSNEPQVPALRPFSKGTGGIGCLIIAMGILLAAGVAIPLFMSLTPEDGSCREAAACCRLAAPDDELREKCSAVNSSESGEGCGVLLEFFRLAAAVQGKSCDTLPEAPEMEKTETPPPQPEAEEPMPEQGGTPPPQPNVAKGETCQEAKNCCRAISPDEKTRANCNHFDSLQKSDTACAIASKSLRQAAQALGKSCDPAMEQREPAPPAAQEEAKPEPEPQPKVIVRETPTGKVRAKVALIRTHTGRKADLRCVRRTLKSATAAYRACYERMVRKGSRFSGEVQIAYTIQPTGRLDESRVTTPGVVSSDLEQCFAMVTNRMRTCKPKAKETGSLTLRLDVQ